MLAGVALLEIAFTAKGHRSVPGNGCSGISF